MRTLVHPEATEVLSSANFSVVPYAERYASLADRLSLNFGNILFTLGHVPLCLDGTDHAEQRADVARLIAQRRDLVSAALPEIVAAAFAPLRNPGPHDMVGEVIVPCIDGLIREMTGADLRFGPDSLVSRIFSQSIGVAKRRRLETELAGLAAELRRQFPDDTDIRLGSRLSLAVLGRDALIGTVSFSLAQMFKTASGNPLTEATLVKVPTHTGVPYIDRQARAATEIGSVPVAAGEVLRCRLQSLEGADEASRLRFFGAGSHVCLGRATSLELFGRIVEFLGTLPMRVDVIEIVQRDDDVFTYPETFKVSVSW